MESESESPIRTFGKGEDAAYEEWVGRHGGYVLIERSGKSGEYMLHDSECPHLGLVPGTFSLTRRPRRWARTRGALVDWAEQNGAKPQLCQTCM